MSSLKYGGDGLVVICVCVLCCRACGFNSSPCYFFSIFLKFYLFINRPTLPLHTGSHLPCKCGCNSMRLWLCACAYSTTNSLANKYIQQDQYHVGILV